MEIISYLINDAEISDWIKKSQQQAYRFPHHNMWILSGLYKYMQSGYKQNGKKLEDIIYYLSRG